ncbi:NAD-dependent epimerase/dehydratase family protein [Nocardia tengchongensis]|uniref:NAD-dependent epimerase/dehydratase family protein n=1 Tax=Nocardia tengchongensis TaxID=2055889 RepID=UPI0036736A54
MIVVTGATGNVGRPLVQALVNAGAPVTAVSRRAAEAPAGVRSVRAEPIRPSRKASSLRSEAQTHCSC